MAAKRRRQIAVPAAISTPAVVLFGWCDTQEHAACRIAFVDSNGRDNVCNCKCHKRKKGKK